MALDLDNRCKDLLTFFLARSLNKLEPIRYGDLLQTLKKSGLKISRPTLTEHLKHLTGLKLVTRTEITRANVTYHLNRESGRHLEGYHTMHEKITEFIRKNREILDSGYVDDHIDNLLRFLVLRQLYQIKYEVLKFNEPEKEFEYNIRILTDWNLWKHFIEGYFLSKARDDENYRENALISIQDLINNVETQNFQSFT